MKFPGFSKTLVLTGIPLMFAVAGWAKPLPFKPGEKLFYEVRWGSLPVAQVCFEVQPFEQIQREQAFHFVFRARTYPAVERLYPVDGRIDGFTDLAVTRSLRLQKDMQEGRSQRTYRVDFDWHCGIATYENAKKKQRRIPLSEGTLDIVSILYFARTLPLETGMEIARPLNSGKKTRQVRARVLGKETIMLDGLPWQAFVIEPDVSQAGGVFEKSKKPRLRLWISADRHRIPLKIVGKVWVGSFVMEMTRAPREPHRLSQVSITADS